jgi:quercetin dioxygenase-like cupin family protein
MRNARDAANSEETPMMNLSIVPLAVAALSVAGLAQAQSPAAAPAIKRTPLGKIEVPGSDYEVVFGIAELAAGLKSGRHHHPGALIVYVAEGEFWYAIDGQPERTYRAGDSFQVAEGAVHNEGAAGGAPAKVMAVYVVKKGMPFVQAAPPAP